MTKQTEKLLPCPFCGNNDYISLSNGMFNNGQKTHYIECPECAGVSGSFFTDKEAIKAWNTRTLNLSAEGGESFDDLAIRLKAVPAKAFLRLPTETPLISAEIMIGELCHEAAARIKDYEDVLADKRRLTRELDVALNGDGAAKQASLCDILAQVQATKREPQPNLSALDSDEAVEAVKKKIIIAFLNMNRAVFDDTADDIAKAAIQAVKGILQK